jgi:PE-PPE domain
VPQTDITEQTNSTGGKITTYLVPTRNLPLTEVLRRPGVDQRLVDRLDTFLRPLIDSAYDQPLPKVPESPTVAARAGIDDGAATRNVSVFHGITNDVTPRDKPKSRTREPVKTDVKTDTAGIHSGAATKDHPFPKDDTTTVAAHDEPKPKKYDSPHKATPVAGTDASAAKPRKQTSGSGDHKRPSGAKPARASHPRPKKS